jgi:hypothetical protein
MSFKGKQNLEGRPKGSANKITTKVKQTIAEILDDNFIELENRMQSLSDSDFVKYYIQLAKFIIPIEKFTDINEPVEDKVFEIAVLDGKIEVTDTYVSLVKGE